MEVSILDYKSSIIFHGVINLEFFKNNLRP